MKVNWTAVSLFLGGILVGGFGGVLRGDWIGREAAADVEARMTQRADREMAEIRADLSYLRSRVDELIARLAAQERGR